MKIGWKLSIILLSPIAAAAVTMPWWSAAIARTLACAEQLRPSDAILVENFDVNYLVFERAAALEKRGLARMVFVPVEASSDRNVANLVSAAIAEVMARHAGLRAWHIIPITQSEPISLNAARQIRQRLVTERVRSVIVVAPGFRSRRSELVYETTFAPAAVTVSCVPVFGLTTPETWTRTWHGKQQVVEEFMKLQYYRFYVMPLLSSRG